MSFPAQRDGHPVCENTMSISVAPLSEGSFDLPTPLPAEPGEYTVMVSFLLKEDTKWAKKGHEVAFGQSVYRVYGAKESHKGNMRVIHSNFNIGVIGDDSWGAQTHPEYLLDVNTKMEFSFDIKGI